MWPVVIKKSRIGLRRIQMPLMTKKQSNNEQSVYGCITIHCKLQIKYQLVDRRRVSV